MPERTIPEVLQALKNDVGWLSIAHERGFNVLAQDSWNDFLEDVEALKKLLELELLI